MSAEPIARWAFSHDRIADCACDMEESDGGKFVKYADHQKIVATLTRERDAAIQRAEAAEAERARMAADVARLTKGLEAVSELIAESHGVIGLHRNGDTATWSELRSGGLYEEWLSDFDDALTPTPTEATP